MTKESSITTKGLNIMGKEISTKDNLIGPNSMSKKHNL